MIGFGFCRDNARHKKLTSLRNAPKIRFATLHFMSYWVLQCFDAVGWAGRASGL